MKRVWEISKRVWEISMLGYIERRHLPVIFCFLATDAIAIYMAFSGDAVLAVCVLAVAVAFLTIMVSVGSGLLGQVIANSREMLDAWKGDRDFSQDLMVSHVDVIAELAEHDPASAERHRAAFGAKLLEHNDGLEEELATLRKKADFN